MKIIRALLITACAVGMISSTALAQSAVGVPGGPFTIATELAPKLASTNLDLQAGDGNFESADLDSLVTYTPAITLNDGDKLTFELSNGLFMDGSYYLVDSTDVADPMTSVGSVISVLDAANGVSSITVRIENGGVASNTPLVLVNSLSSGDAGAPVATVATDTIAIKAASELSNGAKIQLSVTGAEDVGGTLLPGANVAATDVIELAWQFAATPAPITSTIDVNLDRLQFVGGTTDSTANVTIDNDSTSALDDYITVGAGLPDATLTVTGTNHTGIDFTDATTTFWDDSTTSNAVALVEAGDDFAATVDGTAAQIPGIGLTDVNIVEISVDGATILSQRTFTGELVMDFGDANNYMNRTFDLGTLFTWDINGAQFVAPHMFSRDGWESYMVVKTTADSDAADIFIDMFNKDGDTVNLTQADLATLALEAGANGGSAVISASDLLGAAGWATDDVNQDFSATLTVTLPQDEVFVDGFRYTAGSTYPLNVYENKDLSAGAAFIK
jgi:hypothetical protein